MSQEARERNRFIKKYLLEKILALCTIFGTLDSEQGFKKYVLTWKNLASWTTYFWFHVYLNQSWPLFDFHDKVFTSNLPLIRYHNSSIWTNIFQIFLPTPNAKVPVVPTGHNSYHGWMTVCRILLRKKLGATLKV